MNLQTWDYYIRQLRFTGVIFIKAKNTRHVNLLIVFLITLITVYGLFSLGRYYRLIDYDNMVNILHPQVSQSEDKNKVVYLTFDDGPCNIITDKILDVLKKYDVKATFFVVGKEIIRREHILKRINDEGHSIGLHTYSHSFKKAYMSVDAFMNELAKTNNLVFEITGKKSGIIRFPGGSHNRLNSIFLQKIHDKGFKIYDWTHSCEDGTCSYLSPYALFRNSQKKIISRKMAPGVILLMHSNENNINTIDALPLIIRYYRNKGYEFKAIEKDTPEYYSE